MRGGWQEGVRSWFVERSRCSYKWNALTRKDAFDFGNDKMEPISDCGVVIRAAIGRPDDPALMNDASDRQDRGSRKDETRALETLP